MDTGNFEDSTETIDADDSTDTTDARPATQTFSRLPDVPGKLWRHPARALLTI
jgi:hypothetical protein